MQRHWNNLILPLFEIVRPAVVVEIGARGGLNTRNILDYCRDQAARMHVIDPQPIGNQAEISDLLAGLGTHHAALSLEVLPGLEADAVLIDGDHNWYTVFEELRMLEQTARRTGRWPICMLHDVGWPYGRRDSYHVPERIPIEHRQPYARRGMMPGRSELLVEGGYNAGFTNALKEHGPKNGVLTAAEDFIAGSSETWRIATFPPFHGLGLLYAPRQMSAERARNLEQLATMSSEDRDRQQAAEFERVLRAAGGPVRD